MNIDRNSPTGRALVTLWRGLSSQGERIEVFTKWSLTGVAGTSALIVTNIESISKVTNSWGLKFGLMLLVISIILGFYSVSTASSIATGFKTSKELEKEINDSKDKPQEVDSDVGLTPDAWPVFELV